MQHFLEKFLQLLLKNCAKLVHDFQSDGVHFFSFGLLRILISYFSVLQMLTFGTIQLKCYHQDHGCCKYDSRLSMFVDLE